MGVDPDFTTFADKWADVRRKRRKMEDRHFKEHGTNLAPGSSVKESSIQPLSMDTLRAANPTTIGPGKQD